MCLQAGNYFSCTLYIIAQYESQYESRGVIVIIFKRILKEILANELYVSQIICKLSYNFIKRKMNFTSVRLNNFFSWNYLTYFH